MKSDDFFLELAIEEGRLGLAARHGGPFGCVIVKDQQVLVSAHNQVLVSNDPTAHAEVVAIREACKILGDFQLTGCVLYSSCEPCPMCLGAIYWARPERVVFASSNQDAAAAGFDDSFIYQEIQVEPSERSIPFSFLYHPKAKALFDSWKENPDKTIY